MPETEEQRLRRLRELLEAMKIGSGQDTQPAQGWSVGNGFMPQKTPEMADPVRPPPGRPEDRIGPPAIEGPDPMVEKIRSLENYMKDNGYQGNSGLISPLPVFGGGSAGDDRAFYHEDSYKANPPPPPTPGPLSGLNSGVRDAVSGASDAMDSGLSSGMDKLKTILSPESFARAKKLADQQGLDAKKLADQQGLQAHQDQMDAKKNKLEMLKAVSEGFGRMGNIPVAGDIHTGQKMDTYVAENIRNELDDQMDEMTAAERAMYTKVTGNELPKNMKLSRLKQFLPGFSDIITSKDRAAAMASSMGLRTRGQDRADENQLMQAYSKFDSNKVVGAAKEAKRFANTALKEMELGNNPQGYVNAVVAMIRASGDTRISDTDIKLRLYNRGALNYISDLISQKATGLPDATHKKQAIEAIKTYMEAATETIGKEAGIHANRYAGMVGMTPDEYKGKLLGEEDSGGVSMPSAGGGGGIKKIMVEGAPYDATPEQIQKLRDDGIPFEDQ